MFKNTIKSAIEEVLNIKDNSLSLKKTIEDLMDEKRRIKDELADLKKEKELEKVEIEHLIALKEERMKLQISQKEVQLEKDFQKKEIGLMQKNHEDSLKRIEKAGDDMKDIYKEIMLRLPNVNVKMKGNI